MTSGILKAFRHSDGRLLRLYQDPQPPNPRTEWDHDTVMVCKHRRYDLGDKHDLNLDGCKCWDDVRAILEDRNGVGSVTLPVYMLDHSGLTVSTTPFGCPWDSGQVGWITMPAAKVAACGGQDGAEDMLRDEVSEYNQYLQGEVYCWNLHSPGGKLETCGGFYGDEILKNGMACHIPYLDEFVEVPVDTEPAAPSSAGRPVADWIAPVAARIADMIPSRDIDRHDRSLLETCLVQAFKANPEAVMPLVGTAVIEESYFEDLNNKERNVQANAGD